MQDERETVITLPTPRQGWYVAGVGGTPDDDPQFRAYPVQLLACRTREPTEQEGGPPEAPESSWLVTVHPDATAVARLRWVPSEDICLNESTAEKRRQVKEEHAAQVERALQDLEAEGKIERRQTEDGPRWYPAKES